MRAADFTDGTDGEYAIKGNLPGGRLGEGRSWVRNIISRLGRSGQRGSTYEDDVREAGG